MKLKLLALSISAISLVSATALPIFTIANIYRAVQAINADIKAN